MIEQDFENETVVIGALIHADPETRARMLARLEPDLFSDEANRDIFGALVRLSEQAAPYHADTVVTLSAGTVKLQYLMGVEKRYTGMGLENFEVHARQMRQDSAKRIASEPLERLQDAFSDPAQGIVDIVEQASEVIRQAAASTTLGQSGEQIFKEYDRDFRRRIQDGGFTPTHFSHLDDQLTEGLAPGLVVIAARPSMGKTTFVANLMYRQFNRGKRWIWMPIEPGIQTVLDQMVCIKHRIPLKDFYKEPKQMVPRSRQILKSVKQFCNGSLTFEDQRVSLDRVEAMIRAEKPDGVVIDLFEYILRRIEPAEITEALRRLRDVALACRTCVIVVQQIRRQKPPKTVKKQPQKMRPTMEDLKNSGGYEEVPDLILLLHRDKYYDPELYEDHIELNIVKQRKGGKEARIVYEFEGEFCRIGEYQKTEVGGQFFVDKKDDETKDVEDSDE